MNAQQRSGIMQHLSVIFLKGAPPFLHALLLLLLLLQAAADSQQQQQQELLLLVLQDTKKLKDLSFSSLYLSSLLT